MDKESLTDQIKKDRKLFEYDEKEFNVDFSKITTQAEADAALDELLSRMNYYAPKRNVVFFV